MPLLETKHTFGRRCAVDDRQLPFGDGRRFLRGVPADGFLPERVHRFEFRNTRDKPAALLPYLRCIRLQRLLSDVSLFAWGDGLLPALSEAEPTLERCVELRRI